MINTWWFNITVHLVLSVIFIHAYKLATKRSENDGALAIILQAIGGLITILFIPLFKIQFPANIKTYLLLGTACIFYAIAERLFVVARRGLDVSTYSILEQTLTIFLIILGLLFFNERLVINKIIGTLFVIVGNIIVLFKKGKFKFSKYTIVGLLGNLSLAIACVIDVGISDQFNLPIYVSITLIVPAFMTFLVDKIKLSDIINDVKRGNKRAILLVGATWGLMMLTRIRAYLFGSITTIAPITSITTVLNVLVAYFVLKEKDSLPRKLLAALFVVFGIVLINI